MFCPTCGHLKSHGYCAFCSRPQSNDMGTPTSPPPLKLKTCPKCGKLYKINSKYKVCYECRLLQDPHAVAEKEYDDDLTKTQDWEQ